MILSTNRQILHLDLDTFFVSVERLRNRELIGKPVIIAAEGNRSVVSSCSYESRKFGIHSAMPAKMARYLCPDAIFISGDFESYSRYSRLITEIIAERAPLFEKASIDEFYIDVTGMDRFFGTVKWASELREHIIKESGLPISFGLSANKMVSKVATSESKPNGKLHIPQGMEKHFLSPLSVAKIPMIGKKTYSILRSMGVVKVHTLQKIHPELLGNVFGKNGIMLWEKANGIDKSPVIPHKDQKSISTERTYEEDSIDIIKMRRDLISMTEKNAFLLRKKQKLCSCIAVKIRYSNFDTQSRQMHIPYTSSDHILIPKAVELFGQLYNRRMRLRLVGVRFSNLISGGNQISLFDDSQRMIDLNLAMDAIRHKYGLRSVRRAAAF
jgi:DNA polymerase IV